MLVAFLIWDFLWGMPGAFIGLPVTIALFTIWEQNPSTRWIARPHGNIWHCFRQTIGKDQLSLEAVAADVALRLFIEIAIDTGDKRTVV